MFDILHEPALEAGKILLKYFENGFTIKEKTSHHDIVTQADIEAQQIIMKTILTVAAKQGIDKNSIGFIGEEGGDEVKEYTFVIDPLDGTSNFSSRIDYFGVSIACFKNGGLFAGVIYRPVTDELFYGEKQKGAFKIQQNKKEVLQILPHDIKTGFLLTNISTIPEVRKDILRISDKVIHEFKNIRVYGATAVDLCLLSENKCSVVLYGKSCIWDVAAGAIIVRESGGGLYDMQGNEATFDLSQKSKKYPVLGIHPKLLKSFLQKLS